MPLCAARSFHSQSPSPPPLRLSPAAAPPRRRGRMRASSSRSSSRCLGLRSRSRSGAPGCSRPARTKAVSLTSARPLPFPISAHWPPDSGRSVRDSPSAFRPRASTGSTASRSTASRSSSPPPTCPASAPCPARPYGRASPTTRCATRAEPPHRLPK